MKLKEIRARVRALRSRLITHRKAGRKAPRLRKAYARNKAALAAAVRRQRQLAATEDRRNALAWAKAHLGYTEQPAGSNRGPGITDWQASFGGWLVGAPWCGVYVGKALRAGRCDVNYRVASVALIEDDARAGRNGFRKWVGRQAGRPGDAVVLFGRGVHVELIARRISGGYVTYAGNTSAEGSSGSQSNGGMSARRIRPYGQVHGVAVPAYKE